MTYECLQQYWWFLVSLLGALLVFLMFVQGANSMIFSLGANDVERRLIVNSTESESCFCHISTRSASVPHALSRRYRSS